MGELLKLVTVTAIMFATTVSLAQNGPVKMWEEMLEMPTYRVSAPEKAPLFERDFAYQRAKRGVYPYPMNDNPTNEKIDSVHKALFLENDYIKLCVLPGIGGRLFYATDKTNGYEIFYRQSVIKPANVGMLGAWISGGVEWNAFHHHRATSQFPVDYRLVDNSDGSKTIWVGETEHRHRMSWTIGLTLYPDKSYIEVKGRFFNNTPNRNSMLHWNNVATHVNDNYRIIFPETTEFGMFHHKLSHIRWPVPSEPYKGNPDYIGTDISWWKNLPSLTGDSVFIYDMQDDFIGGYDYGKKAGTMLVGNHNICKGGKFWTWGPHAYGHAWDCVTLTDFDGPYVELMTSAYSDNQPDYCWIDPYEMKEFTAWWYGIRDLDNVNRGNKYATVNMDISPSGNIHIAVNTTQKRKNAKVEVVKNGNKLYRRIVDIAPNAPFSDDFKVSISDVGRPDEITMNLYDNDGILLISYKPCIHDGKKPLPEDLEPVNPDPASVENAEECYYIGMRNLQFHQAHVNPNDYFLEVLKRDSEDVRSNTQMGIYFRMNGDYEKAAWHLRKAIKRQTANYTRPADAEAMYNLGLVLKAENKIEAAVDTLYRAAWDYRYASAAYYNLAQLSMRSGDYIQAETELVSAINYNWMNIDAKNFLTTLFRNTGRISDATSFAKNVMEVDPLNAYAAYELCKMGEMTWNDFESFMRNIPENYLDLAISYFNNGFFFESEKLLLVSESLNPYPLVEYWLGYFADAFGLNSKAESWFQKAASASVDYIFPFRIETSEVLETALKYIPESAETNYYLGNLWYQKRPDLALSYWEKAVELKPDFAMALRNIGWYWRFKDEGKQNKNMSDYVTAIDYYKRAISTDKAGNAIFLTEYDEILELVGAPLSDRYDIFNGKESLYEKRYDSEVRAIRQRILAGEYENVLEPLLNHYYPRREHVEDLHDIYVDACLLSGFKAWKENKYEKALKYMLMMEDYPENQGYAHMEYYARDAQIYYNIGLAYEKTGNHDLADKYYNKAVCVVIKPEDAMFCYEKGLAMKKLDKDANVNDMYRWIIKTGEAMLTDRFNTFFESFGHGPYTKDINSMAYYIQAIGHMALGNNSKSVRCFRKAVGERNDNLWANYYLDNIRTL